MSTETTIPTTPVGHQVRGLPEPSGVDARHLVWIACGTLVFLAVTVAMFATIFNHEVPIQTVPAPRTFPQPRVQAGETAELHELLQRQQQELAGDRGANDQRTLVRISIERAMAIIVQRGAQAYAPVASVPGALESPDRAVTPPGTPMHGGPAEKSP